MMSTERCTVAETIVRYLAAQQTVTVDGAVAPMFGGVFAIFGHGNVAGLGASLAEYRALLPTYRAHNEQAMGHAAVAFSKASFRRRMMACTTSIGPGATNLVTAAATAHANRLPVLFLPGDVFASRAPDPVLQQIEDFSDPRITANDCLKPVSRFFDRIERPEQILSSLVAAIGVLTDPVMCGPATIALPQDVQTEALDVPSSFFEPHVWYPLRPAPDPDAVQRIAEVVAASRRPLMIVGGGVLYSGACAAVAEFAERFGVPVAETQAGKSALPADHDRNMGGIGVTGSAAANRLAEEADLILAVGTRLTDFTTASRTILERPGTTRIGINVAAFDAGKHGALALVSDAKSGLQTLSDALETWSADDAWTERAAEYRLDWEAQVALATAASDVERPSDAQVLSVVNNFADSNSTVVCAAGGVPGELHKLWRATEPGSYHVEYGYSCMGYEIAGGLGVKLARPDREVIVVVGDGSYLMLNSEIATSIALDAKLIIVVLDNRGFGCINRLQKATGGEPFNNLLDDAAPAIDFVGHARSLGAGAEKVVLGELSAALGRARDAAKTSVVVIDTDPDASTDAGGAWWDVAVSEVSDSAAVRARRATYLRMKRRQHGGD